MSLQLNSPDLELINITNRINDYNKNTFHNINFKPISNKKLVQDNSELVVMIQLPNNSSHDYIGCIMGYSGTTINLIQKITNTEIKIEYLSLNQYIKIKPRSNNSISNKIKDLNYASNIIMTIIKLKTNEHIPNSKYYLLKEWQDNEKKIIVKVNNEVQKLINSKINNSFINKIILKNSITKLLKEKDILNNNHDSTLIPFINKFTVLLDQIPDLTTIRKKFEFKKNFDKVYNNNFKDKSIIVRGNLIIDGYIYINLRNYSNFFFEINDYEESSFDFSTRFVKRPSKVDIRPISCIPQFNIDDEIIKLTSRTVSMYN